MLKKLDKCTVFSVIFFITVFLFWWLYRPEALYYQEIFQMFLWDSDYFKELISIPGGLNDYVSEFLVQFYYYPVLGAAIIATIFTGLVIITYQLGKYFHKKEEYGFSIIHTLPVMLLWHRMYDVNVMHNLMTGILISLLITWLCLAAIKSGKRWKICAALMMIPASYFLLGPVVYIPLIASAIYIIRQRQSPLYIAGTAIALIIAIAIAIHFVMYPIPRFFYGIDYFRYHDLNIWILADMLLFAAIPAISWKALSGPKTATVLAQIATWGIMTWGIFGSYEYYKYQTIKYLKWTHECKWKEIIEDAQENIPETARTMVLVNTALAFEQKLADSMFSFPQEDIECLLPMLNNDVLHPLLIADALYWMGLNDHAIHYYFESKSGNPTYRGSRFASMRLAECYIINDDYGIAYKYLNQLKKTLFFKDLAKTYINLIEANKTDEYPLFTVLKQLRLKTNGLQAISNMPESFKNLLEENPQNYLAYEYLMGCKLLKCDLAGIAEDVSLGSNLGYKALPMHLQEALIYLWDSKNGNINQLPPAISAEVRTRYQKRLTPQGSYWPYLLTNKDRQDDEETEHEVQ